MLKNEYFESVTFQEGNKFKLSKHMDSDSANRLHWHPFVEILVALADGSEVSVNFTSYQVKRNDIVIICPGDLHSIQQVSEDSFLIIQFPGELLYIMTELRSVFSAFSKHPFIRYDPYDIECDRMMLLAKELAQIWDTGNSFREIRMYSILLQFFEKLGQYCPNVPAESRDSEDSEEHLEYKSTREIAEACLFISQNCTQPLTLDDVARHMGMSKSHFAHLFKQFTNVTFVDFLTAERIKRAQSLISDPNTLVIDIAFDSGFSSVSSFNRAFKKITGMSPSQFRETTTRSTI